MALNVEYTKERHVVRWVITIVVLALVGISGWYGYRWYTTGELPPFSLPFAIVSAGDNTQPTETELTSHSVSDRQPRYISIPSLGLTQSRVQSVSMSSDNVLGVTKNLNDTGWYDKSATPGSGGVIILNGQGGESLGETAFAQVSTLKVGDDLRLERGDGDTLVYRIVENSDVPVKELDANRIKSMGRPAVSGEEGLNLIVSDGRYVPLLGTFDRRALIKAILVE